MLAKINLDVILLSPTFVAVDGVLLDNHGPAIEGSHLLRFTPVVAYVGTLFSIRRASIDRNSQHMAP